MRKLLLVFLVLAMPGAAAAQEEERLWMPDGYRLLTIEERQALAPADLAAIGARNQELLRAAVKAMSLEERGKVAASLERWGNATERTQVEKQYVTMTGMLLMAVGMEEENQKLKQAAQDRLQALLREQEEASKGFPSDQKSVEEESRAVEAAMTSKADYRQLYLRILRPLRARPWNHEARFVFRRIVRGRSFELVEPALAFARARQKESPQEGAWDSLVAFLLLSFKGEVPEAKRLFAVAVDKNANDVESHIFPLLIAQIEGNATDVQRYEPRAKKEWPKAADLEKVLVDQVAVLPDSLREKAKATVEAKYRAHHPADWEARNKALMDRFYAKEFATVEREIESLVALPASVLPEENRLSFLVLRLRTKAAAGRCSEAAAGIPDVEARAAAVHPPEFDPDVAPAPHSESDVRTLRDELREAESQRSRFERWQRGETAGLPPELARLSASERNSWLREMVARSSAQIEAAHRLLDGRDDRAVAGAWSLAELEAWEKLHDVSPTGSYDIFGEAEADSITVRTETGICFLEHGDPLAALHILTPCAGRGRNLHAYCVGHLLRAATSVAESGRVEEAVRVYELVSSGDVAREALYRAIETAAPGRVPPPSRSSR